MSDATPRETFSIAEFNVIAGVIGAPRLFRGGVITIPGFNTTGWWQKLLVPTLQRAGFFYTPVDYGFVLGGIFRKPTLDRVSEQILAAYAEQLILLCHFPLGS